MYMYMQKHKCICYLCAKTKTQVDDVTCLVPKRRYYLMNYPLWINHTNFFMCRLAREKKKIRKREPKIGIALTMHSIKFQKQLILFAPLITSQALMTQLWENRKSKQGPGGIKLLTSTHRLRAKSNPHPCTKSFCNNPKRWIGYIGNPEKKRALRERQYIYVLFPSRNRGRRKNKRTKFSYS